jgi:quinone-modifying oxidoreductase subunit QmoB
MGSCPERIISFPDYSIASVTAMIKAVHVPDEFEDKPRFLALLCENDALPAFELMAQAGLRCNPFVRVVPVRCLGSVNPVWIKEALSCGYDGIVLVGCCSGDDYQCHFIRGSELARERSDNAREALQAMALENERIEMHELQITEYRRLPGILDSMLDVVEEYGPNPFKDL